MIPNKIDCCVSVQTKGHISVVTFGNLEIISKELTPDEALKLAEKLKKCAMEVKAHESKEVVKAINTIKNFCYEQNCESCFLGRDEFGNRVCKLGKITPEYWRLDDGGDAR